jgi:cytochrome c
MKAKSLLAVAGAVALTLSTGAAWADAEAAMNKAGCMACHAKDKKLVGPSFKDIAAKYKGQDAVAALMEKVRTGGKGVYGPIPMPPNPAAKIDDASLKEAVAFILKS